ncbi:MAG: hypothetical protein F6K54_33780 [Okeania sp. SIO3B5]|uniref:hypothetical protein n=1 Tax=Okeania sp. SIO3B5 TaxID=2607811 RepID=UPI0013FF28D7|nr:hypothetical protein [Okeania sp. SIO3B5]NEO57607.1 hypothetical protein [Okeania sp. SIO3B5]
MAKDHIYDRVFEKVYPYVQTQGRGILYKVIQIIHREEKSKSQEETRKICDYLDIKSNANKKEDLKKLDKFLIENIENYHPFVRKGKGFLAEIRNWISSNIGDDEMVETKWIIIGACILVGVGVCIKYLEEEKQKQRERERNLDQNRRQQESSPPPSPTPVSLCLIVPASIASTLKTDRLLNASRVEEIVDHTSYFLCTTSKKAGLYEQDLELTNEDILPDSQREVYIRINLSDGGKNLIDKTTRYALKSNLPDNAEFTLKQLACLKDLSGLQKFNRV